MTYEKVSIEILPDVVALNTEIFSNLYPWPTFTLEDYEKRLAPVEPLILVVKDNESLVANSISFEKGDVWYIWILGVCKEKRGQGIATRLCEINEEYARKNNFSKVHIKIYHVSKDMLHLVLSRGYNVIDIIKNENPLYHATIVEKRI